MVRRSKRCSKAIDCTKPDLLRGYQFVEMHDIRLTEDFGVPLPPVPKGKMARVELTRI